MQVSSASTLFKLRYLKCNSLFSAAHLYWLFLVPVSLHMLMCKWGSAAGTVINFSQTLIYDGRLVYCRRKLTIAMNMQHVLLFESIIFFKLKIPIRLTELESDLFRCFIVLRCVVYMLLQSHLIYFTTEI